ncbi:hypothetical protein TWF281_003095 [Arthrobotrys megalospora]
MLHVPIDYGDTRALDQVLKAYSRYFRILGAVHLAASKSVAESLKNPRKYYDNNVVKMEGFLRVLGRHGVGNVVFSSSATVYGCLPPEITTNTALKEDMVPILDPRVPREEILNTTAKLTPYGISKILGEALVARFVAENPKRKAAVFRLFNPVGCDSSGYIKENPRDGQRCGGGVMQMIRKAVEGNTPFEVYGTKRENGDGSCVRDFVHVGDIASGIVMGFESCLYGIHGKGKERVRVYNLTSGNGVSVKRLVNEVEKESGVVVRMKECEGREGDVAVSVGDIEKARRELGWIPELGIRKVCRDFCRAYGIKKYI